MWTERLSTNTTHRRSIDDHRSPYERDLTRVIHSPAFRKLQCKTQILGINEGDLVGFKSNREFEFIINKQRLYCMQSNDI